MSSSVGSNRHVPDMAKRLTKEMSGNLASSPD